MQDISTRSLAIMGWLVALCIGVLIAKLYLAWTLDLYSDEIFYWWASTRLALAYSDLPFMTALLAGLGSGFGPSDAFAVRSLFILLGSLLPLLIYWLALPLTSQQQALESAALTCCLPLAGFMGLLAVPDVPLVVFGLLSIGFFQRALSNDRLLAWMATGLMVALGFSTHYRFFLYPLAAILFLICFSKERRQWRNPKFWLAVLIASLGLIPIAWFNLSNQLSSASFYLIERHPWQFQPAGLFHLLKQATVVTPSLYLSLILTVLYLLKRTQGGDRDSALLLAFSSINLAVYLILAPWTDANSTSIHWPLSGYLPLLTVLPVVLRKVFDWCTKRWSKTIANTLVLSVPTLGFTGTILAFIGIGSQAFSPQLQPLLGTDVLSNKMAGWKEFASYTANLLAQQPDPNTLLITDNYYTAAQIEFAGLSSNTLTLDRDKAVRDGRLLQLRLWNKDNLSLQAHAGLPALYINEDSTLNIEHKTELMAELCPQVESLFPLDQLSLLGDDKQFSFYGATRITKGTGIGAFPCPYPIQAWIDYPASGARLSGIENLRGWAYSEDIGIDTVQVLLDDKKLGNASYGNNRADVVAVKAVNSDPNAPMLGFDFTLDTRTLTNGRHTLALVLVNRIGMRMDYGEREIWVEN
ncbi:MAG: glycosyltransferase family 39 protein [Gammaproteobacteria bacterium]|nr:glycosyltransferase family 39 protein [Gammaproteobacteria bacterium]